MDRRTRYERLGRKLTTARLRTSINEALFRLPSVLSGPLRSWIADFNPDLVFSMLGTGSLIRLNTLISKWRNIPCVPYLTDDWISWKYSDALLSRWLRPSLIHWFDEYLKRAPLRLTICTAIAEEYQDRYSGLFEPCFHCFEADPEDAPAETPKEGGVLKFLYIGALAPDRWRPLREIGEALLDLHAEGLRAELSVYTHPDGIQAFGKDLTLEPVLRVAGTARPNEVPRLQRSADVLVHVESFNEESVATTRLSMSTKIPQYLLAGRCIFAYGPGEVASMRYIASTKAGMALGQRDPRELRKALRELIASGETRRRLAIRAREVGMENHEASRQQKRLRLLLTKACEKWRRKVAN